jgi:hypothetical protein
MNATEIVSLLSEYGDTLDRVLPRLLGVIGEGIVCSELNKRGVEAKLCPGRTKFVTRLTQKVVNNPDKPDFWVLLQISKDGGKRFFILSHPEIWEIQKARNDAYARDRVERGGEPPDFSKGVDNVTLADVKEYEDQWCKILDRAKSERRSPGC